MSFSFLRRALITIALAVVTVAYMRYLSEHWPTAPSLDALPLLNDIDYYLLRIAFGLVVGVSIASMWQLVALKRFLGLGWVLLVVAGSAAMLSMLPIARTPPFALDATFLAGLIFGTGLALIRSRGQSDERQAQPKVLSESLFFWSLFFLLATNVFLFLAPHSHIVPSGVQEPGYFSAAAFTLESKDSVGIKNNLVFLAAQHLVSFVVGNSILSSSLTSILICAVGIACFATGISALAGGVVATVAVAFMLTDGWVLTAAFAGNLTVTLVASSGALFLVLAWALTGRNRTSDLSRLAVGLLVASFLGLYSYAAVRMPWLISLAVIYCVVAARSIRRQGFPKTFARLVALTTPILALMTLIVVIGYGGKIAPLKKDLLVSWPSTSVLEHPLESELGKYTLIHNPDVPLWRQVARPTNGQNVSYIWTRTPYETLTALQAHLSLILQDHPRFFFLQAAPFFLIIAAVVRLPLMTIAARRLTVALAVWCLIWISSFLLVPDAIAYRRGIAFSAVAACLASLGILGLLGTRKFSIVAPVVLAVLFCVCRLPQQLIFSNDPETRSRMFTVCSSSFAVRALLSSPELPSIAQMPLKVSLAGLENERESSCVAHATRSREWRRLLPASEVQGSEQFESFLKTMSGQGKEIGLVYCSLSSNRLPSLARVCASQDPEVKTVQVVPVVYGGVSNSWVLFARR